MMQIDFSSLHRRLEAVGQESSQILRREANIAKQDIIERTMSGADVNENEFTEYVPAYLRRKQRAGKYRGHVDHFWSGGLFDSITYTENGSGVEIFFSDAYLAIAEGLQERYGRHWWGVNDITRGKILIDAKQTVQQILNGQASYA